LTDEITTEEFQKSLVATMMRPDFYPKPPVALMHRETDGAHLFFADELVYKVKKPLRHPFLDFSTASKRRHFLSEELRLNRRLAPSVYLAVVAIAHSPSGWRLSVEAEAAEYALVMRRLPEKRMLSFLLETHQVTSGMMRDLAEVIANFHRTAQPARQIEPQRHLIVLEKLWNDNMAELRPLLGDLLDADSYRIIDRFGLDFLQGHRGLLARRAEEKWVRDLHGDLHCEHICFAPEGIQIFDCIEFSSQLRSGDLASEVGFLLMDLKVRGGKALAKSFLDRYCELVEDPELSVLLPFYECYRALVRGKLNAMRYEGNENAARYFRHAAHLTWEPLQPFLVLLCGLTGSGKTSLAEELSRRLDLPVFSSERIRQTLVPKPGHDKSPSYVPVYRQAMAEKTYGKIVREAEREILTGRGAILDASFAQRANREKVSRMAAKHNVPVFLIHCSAEDATIKDRLTQSEPEGDPALLDGGWESYDEQRAKCEAPNEIPAQNFLELNITQPVADLAAICERYLRSRLDPREAGHDD